MAGPRATAMVLAALPAVGVLLGQAMGAAPLAVLTGGGTGGIMLVVGVGLACAGLLWTDAIVAEVADRVVVPGQVRVIVIRETRAVEVIGQSGPRD